MAHPDFPLTVRHVRDHVARHYGVDPREVVSRRPAPRRPAVSRLWLSRAVGYDLSVSMTTVSIETIAKVFGKDRSTVYAGRRWVADQRRTDPLLRAEIDALREQLLALEAELVRHE